jgi:hypothetical protein
MTGDETWLFHLTPESKQQSMEWHHTHYTMKKKYKTNKNKKNHGSCLLGLKGGSSC